MPVHVCVSARLVDNNGNFPIKTELSNLLRRMLCANCKNSLLARVASEGVKIPVTLKKFCIVSLRTCIMFQTQRDPFIMTLLMQRKRQSEVVWQYCDLQHEQIWHSICIAKIIQKHCKCLIMRHFPRRKTRFSQSHLLLIVQNQKTLKHQIDAPELTKNAVQTLN